MTSPTLTELASRVERLTGPCRETDLAVHLALWPDDDLAKMTQTRRGLDSQEGYAWTISGASIVYERWTADGRCPHNGGYPLPMYTASLDAAMTLARNNHEVMLMLHVAFYSFDSDEMDRDPDLFPRIKAMLLSNIRARARAASGSSHG